MALLKSLISWVGGKKALRELIYQRFPKNYGRYIEVFGGGGWVLFGKKPDKFEVYNDFNNNLTNMFAVVRDQPLAFIQELGYLPENGRFIFNLYKEIFDEVIRINTLDANVYKNVQQALIDALDKGEYVHILGKDKNETD